MFSAFLYINFKHNKKLLLEKKRHLFNILNFKQTTQHTLTILFLTN